MRHLNYRGGAQHPICSLYSSFSGPDVGARFRDYKAEKYVQHVPNPSSHMTLTSMKEVLEWLRKPIEKTHSSIPQEVINVHNSSLEFDLYLCHPPSSTSCDCLYHDSLDQSIPLASCSHSLDSQATGSICDQVQDRHITQAEEKKGKDAINVLSLIQNCAHQNNEIPFLSDS